MFGRGRNRGAESRRSNVGSDPFEHVRLGTGGHITEEISQAEMDAAHEQVIDNYRTHGIGHTILSGGRQIAVVYGNEAYANSVAKEFVEDSRATGAYQRQTVPDISIRPLSH